MIGTEYGTRIMHVVTSNGDGLRHPHTRRELEVRMSDMKAGIICTQETHKIVGGDIQLGNYRYLNICTGNWQRSEWKRNRRDVHHDKKRAGG